jgi:hypothetical protein
MSLTSSEGSFRSSFHSSIGRVSTPRERSFSLASHSSSSSSFSSCSPRSAEEEYRAIR